MSNVRVRPRPRRVEVEVEVEARSRRRMPMIRASSQRTPTFISRSMVSPIHLQGPLSQNAGIRYVGYHVSLNDSDSDLYLI